MKYFLIIIFAFSINCTNTDNSIVIKINKKIESCQNIESCFISLNRITEFDWDKVYFFKYSIRKSEIERITGSKLRIEAYEEFDEKLIFLYNDEIVKIEYIPTNLSEIKRKKIVFNIDDNRDFVLFTSDNDLFKVSTNVNTPEEKRYYILSNVVDNK